MQPYTNEVSLLMGRLSGSLNALEAMNGGAEKKNAMNSRSTDMKDR